LTHELEHVAKAYSVIVPPYFTLVLRAFSTIEGVCRGGAAVV
jgi:predicted unusual protein kinase regulating ubiquinone biosynthesis (AarF/ABC1/UbiB family)